MPSWCDHPASKAICRYGLPAAEVYCGYCGEAGWGRHEPTTGTWTQDPGLPFNPELMEDPDNRPYFWDLPEGDCKCH